MLKIICQIGMIKENANIIQEDLSLEVNKGYGQRVGLAVEMHGTSQDANGECIEDTLKMLKLNFVLIMENQILNLSIQIVFVENHFYIRNRLKRVKREMMMSVIITVDTLISRTKRLKKENGHVVNLKKVKDKVVLRININLLNIQMKKPKNTFLIEL